MDEGFLAITALRMAEVQRHEEALALLDGRHVALEAYIRTRNRNLQSAPPGPMGDAIEGWTHYYSARYASAAEAFARSVACGEPWIESWSALGLAKCGTDAGFLKRAADWCALAAAIARRFELQELMAAAIGALGEILLRGEQPREAAEAFTLDLALLPPGAAYRGRVLCYRAHAWSRLGPGAQAAAEMAYRIAAHTPGEETDRYALAGLALLGAESGKSNLVDQALADTPRGPHLGRAVCLIARTRLAFRRSESSETWFRDAWADLPSEYVFERRWLQAWSAALGHSLIAADSSIDTNFVAPAIGSADAHPRWPLVCAFDRMADTDDLYDRGFDAVAWAPDPESCWTQRSFFMP
ncbi:MAG: hypothetical protein HY360_25895 [Verrucomicrobia bacterium]|nr:hypothetical protein [Verrucomicrobiota bacterium]